jgi:hypothetical protein
LRQGEFANGEAWVEIELRHALPLLIYELQK